MKIQISGFTEALATQTSATPPGMSLRAQDLIKHFLINVCLLGLLSWALICLLSLGE